MSEEFVTLSPEDEARRASIMQRFSLRRSAMFVHESGALLSLEEAKTQKHIEDSLRKTTIDPLIEALKARANSLGWNYLNVQGDPVYRPDPEPAGETAEDHHARTDKIIADLKAAGVERAMQFKNLPAGWTKVLEEAAEGIIARMSLPDGGRVFLAQMKEKFGTLRFYVEAYGAPAFCDDILDISNWAEACTEGRCCLTGHRGNLDHAGWVLTLSDEAKELRASNPKAFSYRLYPDPPARKASVGQEPEAM